MSAVIAAMPSPRWGLVLMQGILSIIFGFLLILAPGMTISALVTFLGVYWFVMGIIAIVGIFTGYSRAHWGWALFYGVLGIIAGVLVMGHPLLAAVILPAALVTWLAIIGLIMGIIIIILGAKGAGWVAVAVGILSILLGILLLMAPVMAAFMLIITLGIFLIIGGIFAVAGAFRIRSAVKRAQV